jgi:hypothetical protein
MDRRRCLSTIIAVVGVAGAPGVAAAQGPGQLAARSEGVLQARVAHGDSVSVLKDARNAQASFERVRRRYLARSQSAAHAGCGGEMVGRYCYTDDNDTSEYELPEPVPPESPRIIEARAMLLAHLDSASARLPGDEWLAGQHVRYLIESGDLAAAEARARACAATPWWCRALLGLVHHAAWRYPAADSAFAEALAAMPHEERCAWTDLDVLLADSTRGTYRRASCEQRDALNDRLWWLSDPLYLRAGNDRRTEHYARVAMDRIQRRAASAYGATWDDDLGELLRRYGWPSRFAQSLPQSGRTDPPGITAFDPSPSYHFLADADPGDSLRAMLERHWTLRPVGPRERYAPPYATFGTLHQLTSLFRRGDSILIVTAYDTRDDTLMPAGPRTAALIVAASPASTPAQTVQHDASASGQLTVIATDEPMLASIEVIAGNRVRRARLAVALPHHPAGGVRISDVAFFQPSDSLPATVDGFLRVARASATAQRGEKLGLFWELYGLSATDQEMTLRVNVTREGRSWLRRAGERIGLVGRRGGAGFGWRERGRGDGAIAPRAIVVDLAGLDPGEYRIEVSLLRDGAQPVTASRGLVITR